MVMSPLHQQYFIFSLSIKRFEWNSYLQDIFSVVSATIDCATNPFLPPVEELYNLIKHIQIAELNVTFKEGKLHLKGSWESNKN